MKNIKKKLLVALLSATCVTAGAFGFAACKKNNSSTDDGDPQIKAIYNQYVVYAESQGSTALSYEDWLNSIKGANGTNGKSAYEIYVSKVPAGQTPMTEAEWLAHLAGTPGTDGKGIVSVTLNSDETGLVILYTDGTNATVPLPADIAHKHTYGSDYVVVIPETVDKDGLGYKQCTSPDCDHAELVVIPKVKNITPSSIDVEVGLNEIRKVNLLNEDLAVGERVTYNFTARKAANMSWWDYTFARLGNAASTSNAFYKLTLLNDGLIFNTDAQSMDSEMNVEGKEMYMGVLAGDTKDFLVDVDTSDPAVAGKTSYSFRILVERLETPADGTTQYLPKAITGGVDVTDTSEGDMYYVLNSNIGTDYKFTVGATTSLTFYTNDTFKDGVEITDGDVQTLYNYSRDNKYYVKASALDGNISFKLAPDGVSGSKANPYDVTLGTGAPAAADSWYKYTPAASGNYTLDITADSSYEVYVYDDLTVYGGGTSVSAKKTVFTFEAGKTYYLEASTALASLKLSAYNEATDKGFGTGVPIALSTDVNAYTLNAGEVKYYTYTNNTDSAVTLYTGISGGNYWGDDVFGKEYNMLNEPPISNAHPQFTVPAGATRVFCVTASETDETTFGFGIYDANTTIAYTIKVLDDNEVLTFEGEGLSRRPVYTPNANPVAGVEVTVNGETGTTDSNGEVTLNLKPGVYTIGLGDKDGYTYLTKSKTKTSYVPTTTTAVLAAHHDYTVQLSGVDNLGGISVTVSGANSNNDFTTTADTDATGKITFSAPGDSYRVSITSDTYALANDKSSEVFAKNDAHGESGWVINLAIKNKPKEYTYTPLVGADANKTFDVTAEAAYTFGVASMGYTIQITVTNGCMEFLQIVGDMRTTYIEGGVSQYPGAGINDSSQLTIWGTETVYVAIVPNEGQTATVQITYTYE